MAANLTSVVMNFLTPDIMEKIGSYVGLDRAATQKAAGGAVPALLAGLSDLVSTPAGAGQLSRAMAQQQGGGLTDLLRTAGPQGLAETGSSMLSGLFGGRTLDTMSQAVGRFAGLGESGGRTFLSLLGPIVLGALGSQQRAAGLDAGGLAGLLRSQKDQITSSIPPGLADQLGAAGLIDNAEEGLRRGEPEVVETTAADRTRTYTRETTPSSPQWPYWLAAALVLGGLGWHFLQRPYQDTVARDVPARTDTGTVGLAPAALTVDGVNLENQFNSSIDALKSALPGITDAAGAQAALPKINQVTAQLDDLGTRATKLSPEGRSALAKMMVGARPGLDQMVDKAMGIPGVASVARTAIDGLKAKMDLLAKV